MREIYVTHATLADWQALWPVLQAYPGVEYSVDGVAQQLPDSAERVFTTWSTGSPMLRLTVGRARVVFHFLCDDEIECDFVPNEITSQSDLDAVLAFVSRVGDATRKPVIITTENRCDEPLISYAPESKEFEYHKMAT